MNAGVPLTAEPILEQPSEFHDGRLVVPDRPGAGLAWNEDAVLAYRYPG